MVRRSEQPHDTVRKEHQAFSRKLHEIEIDAAKLLNPGQEPTVKNLVRGIQRDKHRASILKKKLLTLATAFDRARTKNETGPWAPTAEIHGAMFFLFDCLKASDPESKWYALETIERPRYLINIVGLKIPTHNQSLSKADKDRVPAQANEDLDLLLLQQPRLSADYVAVEAKRCGFGEVVLDGCAPATEAQRSHPGQAAHRNDKNKGVTKRKRAAKKKPVAASDSDDDEAVDPDPPRKRTRSQTKAAATAAKGKGKAPAKASSSSTRGRRSKKTATPPPVEEPEREEEKEEEERSNPESEDRDTVPPAFRPLARVRLNWEHYPRDESGERIPYYQRDLAERLLATLPSPTTPALKGAVRGIAYYDTGTARKTIKFLKQHVEDLRIGEEKAVQQYDGHKERTTEGLDHVSVAVSFPVVLASQAVVKHGLSICYSATDALAPGESPDDYYRGLSAMKRTLQETLAKLKAAQATSESAEDVDMQDAAAPAAAGLSKAKGKGKNARKGAMPPPAVPDAAGPSPADATAVAVADASGSLKRAGSPTEGDRPAKMIIWDASQAGFAQYGSQGLMVEGLYGASPVSTALGEGASAVLDRARTLARQSYGDGEFDAGAVVHSLAQVTALLNASSMHLGAMSAIHTSMDDARRVLCKTYRRATARDFFGTQDALDDEGVPGSRRTHRRSGSSVVRGAEEEARGRRDASPETAARTEAARTEALVADSEAELDEAIAETGKIEDPQVTEGSSSTADAMEVDSAAPKKKEPSRSSSRVAKKTTKTATRSSAKEVEEETPAIATLPAV
ncbi:hypothetical protein GGG16DRAFT_129749 [Schizophyllum commune]